MYEIINPKLGLQRGLRKLFFMVLIIFVAASFFGYLNGERFSYFLTVLEEVYGEELFELPPLLLLTLIFFNNAVKSFIVIPLGVVLAIPPIFFIFFNGFMVGLFAYEFIKQAGQAGVIYFLAGIVPHGVVELTAVFLSASLGIHVGLTILRKFRGGNDVGKEMKNAIRIYILVVLPLLLIAAIIETFITPVILTLLTSRLF